MRIAYKRYFTPLLYVVPHENAIVQLTCCYIVSHEKKQKYTILESVLYILSVQSILLSSAMTQELNSLSRDIASTTTRR